jgi:uncharacterized damage-inducible protein DinB
VDVKTINPLPGYEGQIGVWLAAMQDTRQRTKNLLVDIPAEILDWDPPESGDSIGTLLYHIAAIELDWLYADILEGEEFSSEIELLFAYDVRDSSGSLTKVVGESLQDYLDRFDQVRDLFLTEMRGMSLNEFRRERQIVDYSVTPEWVVHHLSQHEAEHRGQIAVYQTFYSL